EITERERRQDSRDQCRPGIDAAAEIRIEVARAQHLEAHHNAAGDERDDIDDAGRARSDIGARRAPCGRGRRWLFRRLIRCLVHLAASPQCGPTWDNTNRYRRRREGAALHLPRRWPYILGRFRIGTSHMPLRFPPLRSCVLAVPLLAALIAAGADVYAQ